MIPHDGLNMTNDTPPSGDLSGRGDLAALLRAFHANRDEFDRLIGPYEPGRTVRARAHIPLCPLCSARLVGIIEESVLSDLGDDGTPLSLVALLSHQEALVRSAAARAAATLGLESPSVLSQLTALLGDSDAAVRGATNEALAALRALADGPRVLEFDLSHDFESGLIGTMTDGISVVLERTDRGGGAAVAVSPGREGGTLAKAVCLRFAEHVAVRFLDRRRPTILSVPAGALGSIRIDVADRGAHIEGFEGADSKAAPFTAPAAAAPLGHKPPDTLQRVRKDLADGSLSVEIVRHPGGFLEILAEAHDEALRNGLVYAEFKTKDGDPVTVRDEHGQAVQIIIPLTTSQGGKPYGRWLRHVTVPEEGVYIDIARFSKVG